jgi:hypothetical protein
MNKNTFKCQICGEHVSLAKFTAHIKQHEKNSDSDTSRQPMRSTMEWQICGQSIPMADFVAHTKQHQKETPKA